MQANPSRPTDDRNRSPSEGLARDNLCRSPGRHRGASDRLDHYLRNLALPDTLGVPCTAGFLEEKKTLPSHQHRISMPIQCRHIHRTTVQPATAAAGRCAPPGPATAIGATSSCRTPTNTCTRRGCSAPASKSAMGTRTETNPGHCARPPPPLPPSLRPYGATPTEVSLGGRGTQGTRETFPKSSPPTSRLAAPPCVSVRVTHLPLGRELGKAPCDIPEPWPQP